MQHQAQRNTTKTRAGNTPAVTTHLAAITEDRHGED
jgi:hypothetical protein